MVRSPLSSSHRSGLFALLAALAVVSSTSELEAKHPLETLQGGASSADRSASNGVKEDTSFVRYFKPRKGRLTEAKHVTTRSWLEPQKGSKYISLQSSTPCHGQVLVSSYTKTKGKAEDTVSYLLDLESGDRSKSFTRASGRMTCTDEVAIFSTFDVGPMVFYPESEKLVELDVILPEGARLSHVDPPTPIWAEGEGGPMQDATTYLFRAITTDRTFFFATWEVGQESLHFNALPFDGVNEARYHDGRIELSGYELKQTWYTDTFGDGSSHPRTEILPRLYSVGDAIETVYEAPTPSNSISLLSEGYTIVAGGYGESHKILHPDGEEEIVELNDCRNSIYLMDVNHEPPSALFTCLSAVEESSNRPLYQIAYWTPSGIVKSSIELDADEYLDGGRVSTPSEMRDMGALPLLAIGKSKSNKKTFQSSRTHLLFDLVEGHFWRGEAEHLLNIAPRRFDRLILSTDREYYEDKIDSKKRIPLYVLDMERGEEILLQTYDDCDGRLFATSVVDGVVAVNCVTNEKSGHFRFVQQWSEVIDLEKMTRWRPGKGQYVSEVLPGKRFVMNGVKRGNEILYFHSRKLTLGKLE